MTGISKSKYLIKTAFIILLLFPIYYLLYKIYIPRILAFGCFDDCFNISAGYFLSKGKSLYKDIPFNHQMLMAYISYSIQLLFRPQNIFELILRHRQILLVYGFICNVFLIYRFGRLSILFIVVYEFSKFYIFGDRFLAEGFIVYPIVYLLGCAWFKLRTEKIHVYDYILIGICSWYIIFMREPYTLVALFYLFIINWGRKISGGKLLGIFLFLLLSMITISKVSIQDYYFNLININMNGVLKHELTNNKILGSGLFVVIFYPFKLLLSKSLNIFNDLLHLLSLTFIFSFILFFKKFKSLKILSFIIIALALTNLRLIPTGTIYYEAFHLIPWYGSFIFFISLLLHDFFLQDPIKYHIILITVITIFFIIMVSPPSYIHDKIDPHFDLITGYGQIMQVGQVVKDLSTDENTFFVDGFDELLHWQADRPTSYKFSWYTSFMPHVKKYSKARDEMFLKDPPDFYYGNCPKETLSYRFIPDYRENDYQRFYSQGKPTCLFIKKSLISSIPEYKWDKAKENLYELQKNETLL